MNNNKNMGNSDKKTIAGIGVTPLVLIAAGVAGGYLIWRNRGRLASVIKSSVDYVSPYLKSVEESIEQKGEKLMKEIKESTTANTGKGSPSKNERHVN